MYEHYLAASKTGVTGVDIDINEEEFWTTDENGDVDTNPSAVTITVTYAATTDSEAWITVDGNGFVYPAFGGTGRSKPELDEYAEHAVGVWRAVTGNTDLTCRYKLRDDTDRDQYDDEHIIDA